MEPSGPRSDRPVLWTVTGSDGSDGSASFSLKRRRPASFFFFSPKWCRSEQLQHIFFYPPIRRRFASLKIPLLKRWNPHFSFLKSYTRLCLSQILFWNPPILVSASLKSSHSRRRTVAAHPLSLAPSHRRSSVTLSSHFALRSSVTLSSHFAAQPLSRVAVAAQPRSQCCCRRRSSAQVLNFFSFFFWNFFFFGFIPS